MTVRLQKYLEYLESEEWRFLKEEAFLKADYRCECCCSEQFLVGHHLVYRNPLTLCTSEDIMCMCNTCHDVFHRSLKKDKLKLPSDRKQTIIMTSFYVACDKETPKTPKIRKVRGLSKPRKIRQLTPLKKFNRLCKNAKRAKLTKEAITKLITSLHELYV